MKENNADINELIIRFFDGSLQPAEQDELLQWLQKSEENRKEFLLLRDTWFISDLSSKQFDAGKSWDLFLENLHVYESRKKERNLKRIWYFAVSAVAAIFLFVYLSDIFQHNKENTSVPLFTHFTEATDTKEKVLLSDGTTVWLNAGSRIEYPENFMDYRIVRLEGEAYFHVTYQDSHPFTVSTSKLDITVLGTIFNVSAYQNEVQIVTTLVEGKIALQVNDAPSSQIILMPKQQVVFDKDSRRLLTATVDPEIFTSWVKGYYRFENASFEQLAVYFERTYGITIRFEEESLKELHFAGALQPDQPIETVLKFLQKIRSFRYTIKENQVTISMDS